MKPTFGLRETVEETAASLNVLRDEVETIAACVRRLTVLFDDLLIRLITQTEQDIVTTGSPPGTRQESVTRNT